MPDKIIKVSIVDDNVEVRESIQALLNGTPGFRCIETYASAESMLNHIVSKIPDLILMDIQLPGLTGIEGIRRIKQKNLNTLIIMLTGLENEDIVIESIQAGAIGYITKGTSPIKILEALHEAFVGGSPMSPSIARKVIGLLHNIRKREFYVKETLQKSITEPLILTDKEKVILTGLADGYTYDDIGKIVKLSGQTVKYHIRKIYRKLHASTKSEAVAKALRYNILN